MFYTVYQTTNTVNDKIYIGVHKTSKIDDNYIGSGNVIKEAIKKYGRQAFKKEILFIYDNIQEAYRKENELVNKDFVEREDTYNLVCGGSVSPDYDHNKPRKILRGTQHPNFGKRLSEEVKTKISRSNMGRVKSPETRRKLSEANKGKTSPMKGKKLTDLDKKRKSVSALKKDKHKCIYCDVVADAGNITQFHNEKCKKSPNFNPELALLRSKQRSVPKHQIEKTCPHCNKIGKGPNMTRYHFDKCKSKLYIINT